VADLFGKESLRTKGLTQYRGRRPLAESYASIGESDLASYKTTQ
jgi:hypothetical protein